jgi:hypothetical protein
MFFGSDETLIVEKGVAGVATPDESHHISSMANIIAFLLGLIALILAIPAFIPLLGWLNWLILVIAGAGIAFGAASAKNSGRNFCIVVAVICAVRLWLGGGLI